MSLIRKCDICGRELWHSELFYVINEKLQYEGMQIPKRQIDVCERCWDRLMKGIIEDDKGRSD